MTWRQARASIFRLELLDLSFREKMIPETTNVSLPARQTQTELRAARSVSTWYQNRDVLDERSWQDVHQLRQHVEAALTRFHTLLLQLLVKSFHDHGNLQGEREFHFLSAD